jgi:aryl-alcohol dehydrogenase-like predicted oxidoreductase
MRSVKCCTGTPVPTIAAATEAALAEDDEVDYVPLGRSGLKISPVCLGTVNFGTPAGTPGCDEAEAGRIIGAYLDAGGNIIDTADGYSAGQSEEFVGRAVTGKRDQVVLATKAFLPQGPGPNDGGLSRVHLARALEASLCRLRTDYVDLYQCHHWDGSAPIDETMSALDGFVRSGKVRYLGCSNFTAAQIVESQWAAQRAGGTPFISLQPQYSLVARAIEAEILPVCQQHGMGTLTWSPLGGGILADRYRLGQPPGTDTRMGRLAASPMPAARSWAKSMLSDRNLRIAAEVADVAADLGTAPASVGVAWVADRPGVTAVIIGPRTLAQLHDNLTGFALTLPPAALTKLNDVSEPATAEPVNGMGARR